MPSTEQSMHPTVITHKTYWYQHLVLRRKIYGPISLTLRGKTGVPCVANCQFKRTNKARTLLAILPINHHLHAFTNNITLPRPELCLRTTLVFLFGHIKNRQVELQNMPTNCSNTMYFNF